MKLGRILFVVNDIGYFHSHRSPIAEAALSRGFEIHVAYGAMDFGVQKLSSEFSYHYIPLTRGGTHLLVEARSVLLLLKLFLSIRPTLVHLVTLKPVLYGGIAARLVRVPAVVSAIAGMGSLFVSTAEHSLSRTRRLVGLLLRFALGHKNQRVIFQNASDREDVVRLSGLSRGKAVLIPGSGVDLQRFACTPELPGDVVVTMISRLVRDKGVMEFVGAAKLLRMRGMSAKFNLVGMPDPGNPSSISEEELEIWRTEGFVEYLGYRADIPTIMARSHLIVLPSYREGLPKTLLEAAASGRAVVTTDVPGCRDAVEPGVTAEVVPAGNVLALAETIEALVAAPIRRQAMGRAGRKLVERNFSIDAVRAAHMQLYLDLVKQA